MAYPSTKETFTDPSGTSPLATGPDHAALHTSINNLVEAIQDTVGTTAGTNVLKDFSAGQFPARVNSGGTIVQTLTGGTLSSNVINNPTMGTPAITGGTATNQVVNAATIGTPALTGGTLTLPQIKTNTLGSVAYSPSVGGTTTIDFSAGNRHLVNMPNSAGNVTLAASNVTANQPILIEVLQGTAGLGTIVWFSTIRWSGSATPTPTTTASRKDTFGLIATGTATFDGYIVGQNL